MFQYTYPIVTNSTLEDLLIAEIRQIDILAPLLLLFIFFTILLTGAFSNQRSLGKSNILMWLSISSFVTTIIAFILFLAPGIINLATMVICFLASIIFALMFLLSNIGDD